MIKSSKIILVVSCLFIIAACSSSGPRKSSNSKSSSTTGWDYNNSKNIFIERGALSHPSIPYMELYDLINDPHEKKNLVNLLPQLKKP